MKFLKTALLASAFAGLSVAVPVGATDLGGTATVTIVEAIVITEDAALRFGNISKPTAGSTAFTIDTAGGTSTVGGDGTFVGPPGIRGPGQYDVNGTDGASYAFSVAVAGACSDAALTLSALTHNAAATLDNNNVQVGGTLTVTSAAGGGPETCGYTVTANYS